MRFWSDKGQGLPWKLILTLITGLAGLLILIGAIGVMAAFLTPNFFSQSGCWMSNTLKCGGGVLSGALPDFCQLEVIEVGADMERFSTIVRDTWYQYKQGECDFGITGDEIYVAYAFTPEEDISLADYFDYILNHNRGEEVQDVIYSDYNYLEANTPGLSMCFDNSDNNIKNFNLKSGEIYYVSFYDNQEENINDMILISSEPNFDAGYWASQADLATYAVAGAAGSLLSLSTGGIGAVVIVAGSAAGGALIGAESGLTLWGDPEGGCLVYGLSTPGKIAVAHGEQTV
jgi:hypothetical protein